MVDLIVSLTTTQFRINKIKPVLTRILDEQVGPTGAPIHLSFRVYLNLPRHLKRHVPDWLPLIEASHRNFIISYCEKDYGPITKIFPLMLNIYNSFNSSCFENYLSLSKVWIVTVDDDILYDVNFVQSVYEVILASPASKSSGSSYAYAFSCVKWNHINNSFNPSVKYTPLKSQSLPSTTSLILEGYMGAIYNLACFYPFTQFIDYVNKSAGQNKDCFRSDDFVISYFLNQNRTIIEQVQTPSWNKTKFWNNQHTIILQYGKDSNALHANNHFFDRYKMAASFLERTHPTSLSDSSKLLENDDDRNPSLPRRLQ